MYDPEDRVGWVRTWGGEDSEQGNAVAVGPDGTVVVGGEFWGPADFDPGPGEDIFTPDNISAAFITKYTDEGEYLWTKVINGTWMVYLSAVEVMSDSSIIAAGQFSQTTDFDPGPGAEERTAEDQINSYILKLTEEGEFEWVYVGRGQGYVILNEMSMSEYGNLYIAGNFDQTLVFDTDGGVESFTNNGDTDSYFAKLNVEGGFEWARHVGNNSKDKAWGVAAGPDDSVAVIGEFSKIMDMDPGSGVDEHTADINDVYLIKLDSDGNYEWGRHIQGPGIEFGRAVEVDDDGNIYAAVEHSNQVDFDPDTAGFEVKCDNNYCFSIASYDNDGFFLWASTISGTGVIHDVEDLIVTHEGVILTGDFEGIADFDPGPGVQERMAIGWDTYLLNLSLDGDYDWVTTVGGDGGCSSLSIFQGLENDLFMTGFYYLTVDFDPTSCRDERTSGVDSKDRGAFLWKLNENGNYYP